VTLWYDGDGWGWCGVNLNVLAVAVFLGIVIATVVLALRVRGEGRGDPSALGDNGFAQAGQPAASPSRRSDTGDDVLFSGG
jgi:hypothetical protein